MRPKDTSYIRESEIQVRLEHITKLLGKARDPVAKTELQKLFKARQFKALVSCVRQLMQLEELRLTLGWVNSGGPNNAPAWVRIPVPMPLYGTNAFQSTKITIHIRKSFLEEWSFEGVVAGIAHELSHVLLASLKSPYWNDEMATDLTAMHLGFRKYFVEGSVYAHTAPRTFMKILSDLLWGSSRSAVRINTVGYLTQAEYRYASSLMR